jgi:hypothetical protein
MTDTRTMQEVETGLLRLYQRTRDEWYAETASVVRERRMTQEQVKWVDKIRGADREAQR